jgi:predicted metal-dependent phosphoesterase TrpH
VRADLHCHSSASDGTRPPAEVMARARAAGLDAVALTDHDTVTGHGPARQALPAGLTLVTGMELSCRQDGRSVHLLAYLFDPAEPRLAAECGRIRAGRQDRARAVVDRLTALGVPVTWDQVTAQAGGGVVGRPHIARALLAAGAVRTFQEAFGPQWLGHGGRAHVTRYAPAPADAIGLVRGAGGVAVLAHPRTAGRALRMTDESIAALAAAGLAGIEVSHPDHTPADRSALARLAADLRLVATGGSDDHGTQTGDRIGCDTIAPHQYERLVAMATGAVPETGR